MGLTDHLLQVDVLGREVGRYVVEVGDDHAEGLVGSGQRLGEVWSWGDQCEYGAGIPLQGWDDPGGEVVDLLGVQHAEQWLESVEQGGDVKRRLGSVERYLGPICEWCRITVGSR